ncbi:hypothetical protein A2310_00915 [candidate division WOR-1 bacterium RIFOXYB2_FULL_37_13]|uniref:Uncharacterized protein n=1 Tax=candidate division WOR-1 bacterium RIFOXYB2_FULL_37_13 TaxID=1802579 RepID=A0A1F4ST89_UNCSA|nr:MAG: hypothetical protein A2310_00915 [candidate division WOR-1 bacterium RIFOXYB2_FULL_37_13]
MYKILKTQWKALPVFILLFVCIVGFLYYNSNNQSHKTGLMLSVYFPELDEFSTSKRDLLVRYLASSPQWLLTKERNELYAYRRFVINKDWQSNLNGFYSSYDFNLWDQQQRFQFRVILRIDGTKYPFPFQDIGTFAKADDKEATLKMKEDGDEVSFQGINSCLILKSKKVVLEIFEQSLNYERPFTELALREIKQEFKNLLKAGKVDASILPKGAIKKGKPDISITDGDQGGIYMIKAHLNPNELGYVYAKVFESKSGRVLSASTITNESLEYIGWSKNKQEQFFYNTEITIYEGDWGDYRSARFELWFVPDSGTPERKLVEKNFKIEGWQQ